MSSGKQAATHKDNPAHRQRVKLMPLSFAVDLRAPQTILEIVTPTGKR